MAVSLIKGQNTTLDARLSRLTVVLAWSPRAGVGDAFDLDAVCFMLDATNRTRGDSDFVFYNQLESPCGAVKHRGDDLSGDAGEKIDVDLAKIPNDVQKLVFAASIYDAETRRQNFGMTRDAYIAVVDSSTAAEIARFDLSEDAGTESVLVFGELYKYKGNWKFRALGESFAGGLTALANHFGVETN